MFPFSLAWHFACVFLAGGSAEQPQRLPAALGHAEAPTAGARKRAVPWILAKLRVPPPPNKAGIQCLKWAAHFLCQLTSKATVPPKKPQHFPFLPAPVLVPQPGHQHQRHPLV